MSNRWSPKQLKRERATQIARGEVPLHIQRDAEHEARRKQELRAKATTNPRIVFCTHNVFWLNCTICSKPAKR